MKKRTIRIVIASLIIVMCGAIAVFLVSKGFKVYCPVNLLTGLNCPGCGNTRATIALLHFDFKGMLYYNLLYPLEIAYIVYIYVVASANYIKGKRFTYYPRTYVMDIVILCLIVVWTVVRNCTPLF